MLAVFLTTEVDEIALFRADARLVMRGRGHTPETNPATENDLQEYWDSLYFGPIPDPQTNVFFRTFNAPSSQRTPSSPPALKLS